MEDSGKHDRKGAEYDEGELEVILSLVPTRQNIQRLSQLLRRSEEAVAIVYKVAYGKRMGRGIQKEKIEAAMKKVGINI
jgi:hypothetical protein